MPKKKVTAHKFKDIRSHTIRGKRYDLVWRNNNDGGGLCDSPTEVGKKIVINVPRSHNDEKYLLEVLCHEITHAAFWDLDEVAVTEFGRDLARLLWRCGFRLNE